MNIDLTKTNKLIDWLKNMLYINTKVNLAGKRVVYRGQVYFCELGEGIGSEECKERPCIILQNNVGNGKSQNTIIAPITNGGLLPATAVAIPSNTYSYINKTGNTEYLSGNILLSNIVTVSKARLNNFICDLSKDKKLMQEVDEKMITSIGLYGTLKKLNDTIISDKNSIKRLIEQRNKLTEEKEKLEKLLEENTCKKIENSI